MAKLQFGMRKGLAVDMQWDQRMQDLRYQQQAKKQAEIQAKADAKMYADDMVYKQPMNNFDNPRVKAYAGQQIKMIGKYVNDNPDWETNVGKRGVYSQLINDLKNGEDYRRGVQSDTAWEQAQKDMADLKYANVDFKDINDQWNNYNKFGNQFGEEAAKTQGAKQFIYNTPAPPQDTSKLLVDLAAATEYDMESSFGNGGYKQEVSLARKQDAVKHALASSWAPQLQKDYQAYMGHLQSQGIDKSKAKSIDDFTLERMNPYFKGKKIDAGFAPQRVDGRGSGNDSELQSYWENAVGSAITKPNSVIDFNARAMDQTFSNNGQYNLSKVKTPLGDAIDLGLTNATSTGEARVRKAQGVKPYLEHKVMVRVAPQNFADLGANYDRILDEGGLGQFTPGVDNSWDIRDEFKNDFKKYTDKNGKDFIEFPVWQKIDDPDNVTIAANYNHANYASPIKQDPYNMGDGASQEFIDEAGNVFDANGKFIRKR